MPFNIEVASKIVTLCSLGIAAVAAWIALPLDAQLKRLQTETQQLDNQLKLAASKIRDTEIQLKETETRLKEAESARKLSFDLYQEVKATLEKKEQAPRTEEALRVLIESLAEDPFRYKLLAVLAVGSATEGGKKAAAESSTFFRDEAALSTRDAVLQATLAPPASSARSLTNYDVDVFFCADKQSTSEGVARRVVALKTPNETGRWRLRALPESVNQQPGYRIRSNEVRYNVPEENLQAEIVRERLQSAGVQATLRPAAQNTPWYISIFICQ